MESNVINNKLLEIAQKSEELGPKVQELVSDVMEVFITLLESAHDRISILEQYNDMHINAVEDLDRRVSTIEMNGSNSSCCGSGKCDSGNNSCETPKGPDGTKRFNSTTITNEVKELAENLFGTVTNDNGYQQYINNKRKETQEFIEKVNDVDNAEQLKSDITVLSDFIEDTLKPR